MLSVNTVGLYNIVPSSAKNQRPRVFFHSYCCCCKIRIVGIELLSTGEADSFMGGLVTKSYLTLATPCTVARQAPLSVGFSRQEY